MRTITPEIRALDLEDQVRCFARRVSKLYRQKRALIKLLESIKANGGCSNAHWAAIEKILNIDGSGRAIRVEQKPPRSVNVR